MTIDYDAWARTYDDTRGASPSVLRPLLDALGPPHGRSLLDIGGGTGNFAAAFRAAGFDASLCDLSLEMARRAAGKLAVGSVFVADAQRLPFRDASFDCAVCVNVLGHVPDWPAALREARRVIRGGPFVAKGSTRETLLGNWLLEYLPAIVDYAPSFHYPPEEAVVSDLRAAGFARVDVRRIHYRDDADGSLQALKHFPEALLDDRRIANTATLKRLPASELRAGLAAVRRDYRSGKLRDVIARYDPIVRQYGDGSLFIAYP